MAAVGAPVDLGMATFDPPPISRPGSPIPGEPPLLISRPGSPILAPTPRPGPILVPEITEDAFDGARYQMKSAVFQEIRPYLETLVPKTLPGKKEEKKKEAEPDGFKNAGRVEHIDDDGFKAVIRDVSDTYKGKPGAQEKKKLINNAAVDLWNANSGKVDDLPGLKQKLIAAANAT